MNSEYISFDTTDMYSQEFGEKIKVLLFGRILNSFCMNIYSYFMYDIKFQIKWGKFDYSGGKNTHFVYLVL